MRRILIWLVVVLAALWGGYWLLGARMIERQLQGWITAQGQAGRVAEFSTLRVQGFPSRFDIHAEGIRLADPASGWGWEAPVAELAALSYQPQHYIAVLPPRQRIGTPLGGLEVESADLRASLVFQPGPSFVLDRGNLVARELLLRPEAGLLEALLHGTPDPGGLPWGDAGAQEKAPPGVLAIPPGAEAPGLRIDELRLATRQQAGDPLGHRLGLELLDLHPPAQALAGLGAAAEGLEGAAARLRLDAVLDFDRRLDRHALGAAPPRLTRLRLDDLSFDWGPLALVLSGTLEVDAEGLPQGTLELQLAGWRRMLQLADTAGMLAPSGRALFETALRVAGAAQGGSGDGRLKASLNFRGGLVSLGALPLGAAPRLLLR